MTQTRRLGPTLQSHVDLMRDLSGDLMVCKSGNKTNDTVRYPQRDRYEVRIAEWWQIRDRNNLNSTRGDKVDYRMCLDRLPISLRGKADIFSSMGYAYCPG
jgi:hypothetical protein